MKKHFFLIRFMILFILAGCMQHEKQPQKSNLKKEYDFFQHAGKKNEYTQQETDSLENIIQERKKF